MFCQSRAVAAAAKAVAFVLVATAAGAGVPATDRADAGDADERRQEVAIATEPAERLRAHGAVDLVVIGDSLTFVSKYQPLSLEGTLETLGFDVRVDGRSSRSIVYPDPEFSALAAVDGLRAEGVDAGTWLVELGTNDLYFILLSGRDVYDATTARIRLMLDAIGPGHRIYWINPWNWIYPAASAVFDDVLDELQRRGEITGVIDWATIGRSDRDRYFVDEAHLTDVGYDRWLSAIAATMRLIAPHHR